MKVRLTDAHPAPYVKVLVGNRQIAVNHRGVILDDALAGYFTSDYFEVTGFKVTSLPKKKIVLKEVPPVEVVPIIEDEIEKPVKKKRFFDTFY